jgi:hypothetical protein
MSVPLRLFQLKPTLRSMARALWSAVRRYSSSPSKPQPLIGVDIGNRASKAYLCRGRLLIAFPAGALIMGDMDDIRFEKYY